MTKNIFFNSKGNKILFQIFIVFAVTFLMIFAISMILSYFIEGDLSAVNQNNATIVSLIIAAITGLLSAPVFCSINYNDFKIENSVKSFSEKYKVGDTFWAINKILTYNRADPSTVLNDIFHFTVKEINLEESYFKLMKDNESFIGNGMDNYTVFENKTKLLSWIRDFVRKQNDSHKEFVATMRETILNIKTLKE